MAEDHITYHNYPVTLYANTRWDFSVDTVNFITDEQQAQFEASNLHVIQYVDNLYVVDLSRNILRYKYKNLKLKRQAKFHKRSHF